MSIAVQVSLEREHLFEEAQHLKRLGWGYTRIAARLEVPRSTVIRWVNPASAERQRITARRRKESYRGTCRVCGASTNGGNGPGTASDLCWHCRPNEHRTWTREAVIAAIQAWAAEHGRPPGARDWLHADPDGRWPAASGIYRTVSNPTALFSRWAEAIEVAGFARPRCGRTAIEGINRMQSVRELLRSQPRTSWREVRALLESLGVAHARSAQHTGNYLCWLMDHGYAQRLSRGLYAGTVKRSVNETAL